jgi:hypothetical protein
MNINIDKREIKFGDKTMNAMDILFYSILMELSNETEFKFNHCFHNNRLFSLFCYSNHNNLEDAVTNMKLTIKYILDYFVIDREAMLDQIKISLKKQEEALTHFWKISDIVYNNFKKNISFRNKVNTIFMAIEDIVENLIAKEIYPLYSIYCLKNGKIPSDERLNNIIEYLADMPMEYFDKIDIKNIEGISINQWRNIAAHSSYKCENNFIEISYSTHGHEIITFDKLESVLFILNKYRIFLKIVGNLCIEAVMEKEPSITEEITYVPETVLSEINASLKEFDTKISKIEITNEIKVNGKRTKFENDIFYIKVTSNGLDKKVIIVNLFFQTSEIIKIFNGFNSLKRNEELILVFDIKFIKLRERQFCSIGSDEIERILRNPMGYCYALFDKLAKNDNFNRM